MSLRHFVGTPKYRANSKGSESSVDGGFLASAQIQATSVRDILNLSLAYRLLISLWRSGSRPT